jgi:glucoamylase
MAVGDPVRGSSRASFRASPLEDWLERESAYAASAMLRSVSPVDIVKVRPGFGQTIRPVKGSIVASPVLADWNPEPDYFFHWYRDSAVVVEALRLLHGGGRLGEEALAHVGDFTRFSLALAALEGSSLVAAPQWRSAVVADFTQYLREDADLVCVSASTVPADTRVNPDGTLDISRWNRPQHDGPPLRALALLRWARHSPPTGPLAEEMAKLIRADLAFTFERWSAPSYDIWEEDLGLHYYTLRVSAAALAEGSVWLKARGDDALATVYIRESETILRKLDGFWLEEEEHYRSRVLHSGARSVKELDIAVILAAIHAEGEGDTHTVRDVRQHATLARLEALFEELYPINHGRPTAHGPAMGRYRGDVYFSGGAYFFSTLGAAEFCFRAASGAADPQSWIRRGDAYLETVRAYTPDTGELSEQFDQRTGAQTSARHLAWSYASFISCVSSRRAVMGRPS